jgi:hypothetical protein
MKLFVNLMLKLVISTCLGQTPSHIVVGSDNAEYLEIFAMLSVVFFSVLKSSSLGEMQRFAFPRIAIIDDGCHCHCDKKFNDKYLANNAIFQGNFSLAFSGHCIEGS